jgi:hypothetical protein
MSAKRSASSEGNSSSSKSAKTTKPAAPAAQNLTSLLTQAMVEAQVPAPLNHRIGLAAEPAPPVAPQLQPRQQALPPRQAITAARPAAPAEQSQGANLIANFFADRLARLMQMKQQEDELMQRRLDAHNRVEQDLGMAAGNFNAAPLPGRLGYNADFTPTGQPAQSTGVHLSFFLILYITISKPHPPPPPPPFLLHVTTSYCTSLGCVL